MFSDEKPAARAAGVCLHITSLDGPYGIGELGRHARDFIDRLAQSGLRVWQFLPLGPTGFGNSPYQPLSTFAGNPLLIDIDALLERGWLTPDEVAPLRALPAVRVDFGRLIPLKMRLLAMACDRFEQHAPAALKTDRDRFTQQHAAAWLDAYCDFRILKTLHEQRAWTEWPDEYRRRDPAALQFMRREQAAARRRIVTTQFLFDRQWRDLRDYAGERGVQLFGDMPIYLALDSADAWRHPELLQLDEDARPLRVAGVPPDYFSADGQLWGNPLYDWPRHAATGFAWWVARLRSALQRAELLRIDHFRGFESYWAVPAGAATARDGAWHPGPGDALFDALRAELGELPVVAEDLGVITPEVEALRDRQHLPGMQVLQFMVGEADFRLADIRWRCVVYTGTHDNDTTLGWFQGGPGDTRSDREIEDTRRIVLRHTGGTAATVAEDMIALAFESPAALAVAPMQDYLGLGSGARLNTPGAPQGNWSWRLPPGRFDERVAAGIARRVRDTRRG